MFRWCLAGPGRQDTADRIIALLVVVWAIRLGSFLFQRILAEGADARFDRIKPSFHRFLMTWTLQGLWVLVTVSAGLAAITGAHPRGIDPWLITGATLWFVGFAIETTADLQKRRFRAAPGNRSRFIDTGLWRISRHPNYCGEILLWTGIAIAALPSLTGWQHATLLSPLFVYLLLTRISGVNLLEARGMKRWGNDADYLAYLRDTPVLFPLPGRNRKNF